MPYMVNKDSSDQLFKSYMPLYALYALYALYGEKKKENRDPTKSLLSG